MLPPVETWPHRPCFVRFSPRAPHLKPLKGWATQWGPDKIGVEGGAKPPKPIDVCCPINTETVLEFESELFIGKVLCRFKGVGCPSNPSVIKTKDNFYKRKGCSFQVLVQGRFKEEVPMSDVITGNEFRRHFEEAPPKAVVYSGVQFFKALTPGLEADVTCDEPYYYSLLAGTVTTLTVQPTDKAQSPLEDFKEETARLGGEFKSGTVSISKRCKILGNPQTAKKYAYNTTDTYGFDYFQTILDLETYALDLNFVKMGLARHMNGQPVQIMAKHTDGRYLYNFEIQHEAILAKSDSYVHPTAKSTEAAASSSSEAAAAGRL